MARGIAWPVDPKSGKASSTKIGKSVWCEVLNALGTDEAKKLAGAINKERGWRANYTSYIVKLVELQAAASPEVCLASCKAGLDKVRDLFFPLRHPPSFHTYTYTYRSPPPSAAQLYHDLGVR